MNEGLKVEGLADLRRALKQAEKPDELKEFRDGLKDAAEIVARDARGRVVSKSGRARASVRATAGGNRAFVVGGKARVPYYGWLDFGSRRPRSGRSRRVGPWQGTGKGPREGRFIYPALRSSEREMTQAVESALDRAFDRLGV